MITFSAKIYSSDGDYYYKIELEDKDKIIFSVWSRCNSTDEYVQDSDSCVEFILKEAEEIAKAIFKLSSLTR